MEGKAKSNPHHEMKPWLKPLACWYFLGNHYPRVSWVVQDSVHPQCLRYTPGHLNLTCAPLTSEGSPTVHRRKPSRNRLDAMAEIMNVGICIACKPTANHGTFYRGSFVPFFVGIRRSMVKSHNFLPSWTETTGSPSDTPRREKKGTQGNLRR